MSTNQKDPTFIKVEDMSIHLFKEVDGTDSVFIHIPRMLKGKWGAALFFELSGIPEDEWETGSSMGNKIPRLIRWHSTNGFKYKFASKLWDSKPYTKKLQKLQDKLPQKLQSELEGFPFPASIDFGFDGLNSVLVNKYRDFADSITDHADDEKEFGSRPTIVSVNLGASRKFNVRRFTEKARKKQWDKRQMKWIADENWKQKKLEFELEHGDVLVMAGSAQDFWVHGVPKEPGRQPIEHLLRVPGKKKLYQKTSEIRYNLTFRPYVFSPSLKKKATSKKKMTQN
jgi:alkylated DNA repair dioxygenase AlkB